MVILKEQNRGLAVAVGRSLAPSALRFGVCGAGERERTGDRFILGTNPPLPSNEKRPKMHAYVVFFIFAEKRIKSAFFLA